MYAKTTCPFSADHLIFRTQVIEGLSASNITTDMLYDEADKFCDDYEWPEDEGFGSSDMTFAIKEFVDGLLDPEFKTVFNPRLSIVKK